jgi:hypothetical protein
VLPEKASKVAPTDVVAGDRSPPAEIGRERHEAGARFVGERARSHDRPPQAAGGERLVGVGLGLEVGPHRSLPRLRRVGADRRDDDVALDPQVPGGVDQLDRGAVVDRALALRAAAGPGAGGEDDSAGARDLRGDRVRLGVFEVDDDRLGAGGRDVGGMIGVAHQGPDAVSRVAEEALEAQRDLSVASGDGDVHPCRQGSWHGTSLPDHAALRATIAS